MYKTTKPSLLFYAAENVDISVPGLDLKVKVSRAARTACKVDKRYLLKADVKWRFVDVDKSPLQWIQEAAVGFVGAANGLGSRSPVREGG